MKYKFLCDFPLMDFKKGDETPIDSISRATIDTLLKLGIIEEAKEWKPLKGDSYWTVNSILRPKEYPWYGNDVDKESLETGNYFKTQEEAQAAAEHLKKALQEFRENK